VKHVLSNLPKLAKLMVKDLNKKENIRALLVSLKKEADALRRHRVLSSGRITPDAAEIAALQGNTNPGQYQQSCIHVQARMSLVQ
jgi:hypothetical protein